MPANACARFCANSVISADVVIEPGKRALIPTGLQIALPAGYEAQIRPRSGLARLGTGLRSNFAIIAIRSPFWHVPRATPEGARRRSLVY